LFVAILIIKSITAIFSLRSFTLPIYKIKQLTNSYLFMAVGIDLILLGLAVYLPFFNKFLKTEPLGVSSWLIVLGVSLINIIMIEIVKAYYVKKAARSIR
ncbi:MAG: cation transporting ATPase C-terminal domain-containing protein, partial [Patescibacteria group bacterium]